MEDASGKLKILRERIDAVCARAGRDPAEVTLIGVSKTVPAERLREFLDAGLRDIGENYVQEAVAKIDELARTNVRWHFIGALQSNKAKPVVARFDLIHSVDRLSLAKAIDKAAAAAGKVQNVLLQVKLGDETTKSGCAPEDVVELLTACRTFGNLRVNGLMGLPPYEQDAERTRPYFRQLRELRDALGLRELSMGMTHDFEIAIEEGATLVRVGTGLFGSRG